VGARPVLRNGLYLVADEAARRSGVALAVAYRDALILGSLREDILWLRGLDVLTEYPSFRHFGGRGAPGGYLPFLWPGPRRTVESCFRRALSQTRDGHTAAAFVTLGRALHVLTDVCIPTHVHRVAHEDDPFEWSVEANLDRLRALPVPEVDMKGRPSDLVASLAKAAAAQRPDRTNTPLGRALRRAGVFRNVGAAEARAQTDVLVPLAIAHATALVRMFSRAARLSATC
jgi:hypothetical protein